MKPEVLDYRDVEILHGLADCDMNIAKTSRELFMSRSNLVYHLEKIKEKTGFDPLRFWDLMKLVNACRHLRKF